MGNSKGISAVNILKFPQIMADNYLVHSLILFASVDFLLNLFKKLNTLLIRIFYGGWVHRVVIGMAYNAT